MARLNNVDVEKVQSVAREFEQDPNKARKTQIIEGEWLVDEGSVQFRSTIEFEKGKTIFEADNPTMMGGGGNLPGPMHYCFYGLASCYTGTFATMAAMLGIKLKKLTTRVEADVNFSRVFGLSDEPVMQEVRVTLHVESDAPKEKIEEAEKLAQERCPVVFTLRNPVKLTTKLDIA